MLAFNWTNNNSEGRTLPLLKIYLQYTCYHKLNIMNKYYDMWIRKRK